MHVVCEESSDKRNSYDTYILVREGEMFQVGEVDLNFAEGRNSCSMCENESSEKTAVIHTER